MVRAYVVVNSSGEWLSRPFGSAEAASKAAKRMKDACTILEITTFTGGLIEES